MTDPAAPPAPRRLASRVPAALACAVSAASVVTAWGLTRTAWFRSSDSEGTWHGVVLRASAILFPAAILLFALGVQWALARRPLAAVAGLVPLPAWIASLHLTRLELPAGAAPDAEPVLNNANMLVNDVWLGLLVLRMQGIDVFGGS